MVERQLQPSHYIRTAQSPDLERMLPSFAESGRLEEERVAATLSYELDRFER